MNSSRMKFPSKKTERAIFKKGYSHIIGIDEVGMGCLAGPVVVCAVAFEKDFFSTPHRELKGIHDSKLLTVHQRDFFSQQLKKKNIRFSISLCSPQTIDRVNIYQASRQAMRQAIRKLKIPARTSYILVDGNKKIASIQQEQEAIIKGDRKVFTIACASVLAKVFRDKAMARYAKKFPGYGFEKHKGYGTKFHYSQLAILGPSLIHRRSFLKGKKLL